MKPDGELFSGKQTYSEEMEKSLDRQQEGTAQPGNGELAHAEGSLQRLTPRLPVLLRQLFPSSSLNKISSLKQKGQNISATTLQLSWGSPPASSGVFFAALELHLILIAISVDCLTSNWIKIIHTENQ